MSELQATIVMNLPRPLIFSFLVLAAAGIWFYAFRSSEEDKIRQRLDELSQTITTATAEGMLGKARIISSFQDLFANPVAINTRYRQAQGIHTPKELAASFLAILQSGKTVSLSFHSPHITFESDEKAKVKTTLRASVSQNNQTERAESQQILITLAKTPKDNWVFERFDQESP